MSRVDINKNHPICTGVLDYFPDALYAIANLSRVGNEQHNPGEPMHWARHKSTDHADALMRHLTERGRLDLDGVGHTVKVAWRALALLQTEIELRQRRDLAENVMHDRSEPPTDMFKDFMDADIEGKLL
jgi:predicted AAA+ superfamily ATPase